MGAVVVWWPPLRQPTRSAPLRVMRYLLACYDYGTWQHRDPALLSFGGRYEDYALREATAGDRVVVYMPKVGYVAVVELTGPAEHAADRSPFGEEFRWLPRPRTSRCSTPRPHCR